MYSNAVMWFATFRCRRLSIVILSPFQNHLVSLNRSDNNFVILTIKGTFKFIVSKFFPSVRLWGVTFLYFSPNIIVTAFCKFPDFIFCIVRVCSIVT